MKTLIFTIFAAAFAGQVHAGLLTITESSSKVINGVTISKSAIANLNKTDYKVVTVGSGLRQKRVILVLDVYVAELMVADDSRFTKTPNGALASLDNENTVVMRLDFLMDVPVDKTLSSFEEGFAFNKVSLKDPEIAEFMSDVKANGSSTRGSAMNIVLHKNDDGSETVAVQNGSADPKIIKGTKGLTVKIMSLWLGNVTHDSYLVALKTQLLQ